MEAKELRLNNLLRINDGRLDGCILKVHGVNALNSGHVYDEDDCIYGLDMVEPIPLSEEWLLKLGFEKGDNIMGDCFYIERQYLDDFVIHHYKNTSFEFFPYDVTVTHVHQLQNLFYALSGEELTFND